MNVQSVKQLIKQGENEHIEFKEKFNDSVIETLVAFANAHGGKVLAGVNDNGKITGTTIHKETMQSWLNEIRTKTYPYLFSDIEDINTGHGRVVIFSVKDIAVKPK